MITPIWLMMAVAAAAQAANWAALNRWAHALLMLALAVVCIFVYHRLLGRSRR